MPNSVFLTGATGYLGRHLLGLIEGREFSHVACLVRNKPALPTGDRGIETVVADISEAQWYMEPLSRCDTVIHLAAATGKLPKKEYFRVNEDGTRILAAACRDAGVKRFLHVSTIAVKFRDVRHYHYAISKRAAEGIVADSGMAWCIVRPTMIFGEGAPVLEGLTKLASAPVVPVFGDGRALVQPVFVGDLARMLLAIVRQGAFDGRILEAGGPQPMTIEELLAAIRRILIKKPARFAHLPARPCAAALALLEKFFLPVMPLTAGQLATFTNDGCAPENALGEQWGVRPRSVEEMLGLVAREQRTA